MGKDSSKILFFIFLVMLLSVFQCAVGGADPREGKPGQAPTKSSLDQAQAARANGDFAGSIQICQEMLGRKPVISEREKQAVFAQLAVLEWNVGEMPSSKSYYEKSRESATSMGDSAQALLCAEAIKISDLYSLAKENRIHEKYKDAISLFNEAIALARKIHSREHELKCLRQLGATYWNLNQFDLFHSLNIQALEIAKALHHQGEQGVCHNNIGLYHWKRSDYSNAIKHFQTALEIAGRNRLEYDKSDCMTNLGLVYSEFGDYENAKDYIASAMEVDAKAKDAYNLAVDYNNYGMIQKNIGLSSLQMGHVYAAIESYGKSYDLAKEISNKNIQCIASANLGEAFSSLNQCFKAIFYFNTALILASELGNTELEGQINNNLGRSYLNLAQIDAAMAYFHEAIRFALSGPYANQLWEAYSGLGQCYEARHDAPRAMNCYFKSIDIVDSIRSKILLETYKIGFSRNKLKVNDRLIHLIWDNKSTRPYPDAENDIFNQIEKIKARSFLECLSESSIDVLENMDDVRRKELLDSSGRTSSLSFELANQKADAALRQDIGKKLAREEENYFRLMSNSRTDHPALASLISPRPAKLKDVQNALTDEHTALVDYYLGDSRSFLIYISHKSIEIHPLPSRAEIEKLVAPYIKLLSSRRKDDLDGRKAGKRIFRLLLSGLGWERQSSIDNLIVIPDGILNFLPFETLIVERPDQPDQYLISGYAISYAPSASVLIMLKEMEPKIWPYRGILALGNPNYAGARENIRLSFGIKAGDYNKFANSLSPLPFSEEEIEAITAFFPQDQRKIFLGNQAREDLLKDSSRSAYQIIHLACHGIIDESVPYRSSLILSPNHSTGDDGILHAWELYNLKLKANLVVLSACQTGSGAIEKAEGVLGLTRIFFYAGANSILSTLWTISDKSTVFFMRSFYENLSLGYSKAQALRSAKIAMMNSSYSDPYYWAGFVLSGNASSKIKFDK